MAGLVPAIHVLSLRGAEDVDARHKAGHDAERRDNESHLLPHRRLGFSFAPGLSAHADTAFQTWLQSLWPQAQAMGVSRATFDLATRGLEPDLTLPDLVLPGRPEKPSAGQPEFVQTPADYVKEASIERLAADGRKLYDQYRPQLTAIEREFGTPPSVLLAIYGRETDYGRAADKRNAIRVLATQAYTGKRKEQFLNEFLLALKILDQGHFKPADMKSSWAGAMGLTQLMPSDYVKYAVDFDGDGKADIWNSVPDALASAAKQLRDKGWQRGLRWSYEVHPPADLDCTIGVPDHTLTIGEWLKRGFVPAFGRALSPDERAATASLVQVAGPLWSRRSSPPRTTSSSRNIISPISMSSMSAISPTRSPIPRRRSRRRGARSRNCRRPISSACRRSSPSRGYYHDKIDGKAGMLTRSALGAYQKSNGLKLDCWPTAAVLQQMQVGGR